MDLRFPIWEPAPGNNGPSRFLIQGAESKPRSSNTICLVTVERGRSCDTISFFKLILQEYTLFTRK